MMTRRRKFPKKRVVEKQFGDPLTLSEDNLKLALTFSGGLAIIDPDLCLIQDIMRQASFKNLFPKHSTNICPPLKSRKYFFPFEKLPTEIRHEIWKLELTALQPRIVQIYYYTKVKKTPIRSKTGVPAILHVCQESRGIGLKVYKKLVINHGFGRDYMTGTFVNWERDILYINTEQCLRSLMALPGWHRKELSQMCRRLAINERGLWSFVHDLEAFQFPKLEELIKVSPAPIEWGELKKPDCEVSSFENVTYNSPRSMLGDERGAQSILRFFKRHKRPGIKIGHQTPTQFPYLRPKEKKYRKEQAERDRVCDEVMFAAYKLQTSIAEN